MRELVGPLAVIATANLLNNRWLVSRSVVTSVGASAALLAQARRRGLSWSELGLDRAGARRGLVWALGSATAIMAGYGLAYSLPVTRAAFVDTRAKPDAIEVAKQALVHVPLGTVLLEEIAFRGVIPSLAQRRFGQGAATATSAVLFGLWHILPSLRLPQDNQAAGEAFAGRSPAAVAASAVAFTGAAGVLLGELRRRSGSLLAPAGLHWATNGLGYAFACLARARPPAGRGRRS
jgi:membrane protease YdiL (CAAX protease family)